MLVPSPPHYLYTHPYRRRLSTPQLALVNPHPPLPTSRTSELPLTQIEPPFVTLAPTCTCSPTNSVNSVLINGPEIRHIKTTRLTLQFESNSRAQSAKDDSHDASLAELSSSLRLFTETQEAKIDEMKTPPLSREWRDGRWCHSPPRVELTVLVNRLR